MGANATTSVPTYVAGEVLTAADLNVTNSGIPVFADSTARTNGFGGTGEKTLAEGQYAYLESDDKTYVYDGSSWKQVGGSGLVVVKAETSFSASSSVTADNIFTSDYTNYMMTITATTSTTATVRLRYRTSGSSNSTSNYNFTSLRVQSTGVFGGLSSSQDRIDLHEGGQTNPYSSSLMIYSPQTATRTQLTTASWNNNGSATAYQTHFSAGNFAADTQFDGIEIYPSAGNMTGSYTIYGLAKS